MAHRASQSTGRASLDASFVDTSMASIIAPSEADSESFSEASASQLGPNKNAVAYLVYHDRGDPHVAGYKQPTIRDIPQVKLPRVEAVDALEVDPYLKELGAFERHSSLAAESGPANPPLDSVPDVFFDSDFHLDNPRVFDAVMGEDSSVLQEKLSWYVDVVEAQLEKEIAAASSQFFSATASFRAIEDQATGLSRQIAAFKSVVDGIQDGVVAHYDQTANLQAKLRDLDALLGALAQLAEFTQVVDSLALQDPAAILDRAAKAREIATQGVDLKRVTVLYQYFDKLDAAENQARNDAASHFVTTLLADLKADSPHPVDVDAALALATRAGVTKQALDEYSRVLDHEVHTLVRKQLPGATDDESQGLARSLHTLSAEEAEQMCRRLFMALLRAFERLRKQPISLSMVQTVVKGADSRLARVLRVRKDPATVLSVTQFEHFFADVRDFCSKCESLTQVRPRELSEFLVAQTKLYIHSLHSASDEKLAAAMDADDWRPAEIQSQVQAAVDIISSAGSMDPSEWSLSASDSTKSTSTLRVLVDGQPYIISKSTQSLLKSLVNYLQLMCVLPTVHSSESATALLELLRLFNHKAHHLILGFGAKATAGLKHISVKNLMLTFESLRLVYNLLVPLKRCAERHITASGASILDSFDSVQQNYFDHRAEIESKLIKLMSDKVNAYARQIASTDWSVRQPEANRYIQGLMNDTTKVARVAQEMLPPSLAHSIVAAIFSAYKPALLEAYGEVTVHNSDEKENVLRDLRYFKAKELVLNGQSRSGDVIYESVKMFVGPDVPEREPDLVTESRPATSVTASPRTSVESNLAVDARQAFATAVAQGNAQAELAESGREAPKSNLMNGSAKDHNVDNSKSLNRTNFDAQKMSKESLNDIRESERGRENKSTLTRDTKRNGKREAATSDFESRAGLDSNSQSGIESKRDDTSERNDPAESSVGIQTANTAMKRATNENEALDPSIKVADERKDRPSEIENAEQFQEKESINDGDTQTSANQNKSDQAKLVNQFSDSQSLRTKSAEQAEQSAALTPAKVSGQPEESAQEGTEEAEAKRQAEEAEAKRQAEEAEAKRQAEEAEAKKRQAEEAEAKRQAEEAEAKRQAAAEKQELEANRQAEQAEAGKHAAESRCKGHAKDILGNDESRDPSATNETNEEDGVEMLGGETGSEGQQARSKSSTPHLRSQELNGHDKMGEKTSADSVLEGSSVKSESNVTEINEDSTGSRENGTEPSSAQANTQSNATTDTSVAASPQETQQKSPFKEQNNTSNSRSNTNAPKNRKKKNNKKKKHK